MSTLRKSLSEMRTDVRYYLDESTPGFWTNAALNQYINESMALVWTEVRKLKADYFLKSLLSTAGTVTLLDSQSYAASSFQIVAGTREYTLPQDFAEMKLIECTTSGYEYLVFTYRDFASLEMRAARMLTDNQTPVGFYFTILGERTLSIAPKSDTTLDLRIWYVPLIPELLLDASTTEMPYPLYKAVQEFSASKAFAQDNDARAAVFEQMGNRTIASHFGGHARQTQDPEFVEGYLGY